MIKVIFLDIDDTLLSFQGYVREALKNGFAEFSLGEFNEEKLATFHRVNHGLWHEIEQGTLTFEELQKIRFARVFEALGIEFDGITFETYFRSFLHTSAIEEPHAKELLAYLAKKYTLCAASNGPDGQQRNRLRIGGMAQYFSHCFISSAVGAAKPAKAFFDFCFDTLRANGFPDLDPAECLIIGDSLTSDMAGGIAYGMQTCLYTKTPRTAEETAGITYVVSSLDEIKRIL